MRLLWLQLSLMWQRSRDDLGKYIIVGWGIRPTVIMSTTVWRVVVILHSLALCPEDKTCVKCEIICVVVANNIIRHFTQVVEVYVPDKNQWSQKLKPCMHTPKSPMKVCSWKCLVINTNFCKINFTKVYFGNLLERLKNKFVLCVQ